MGTKAAVDYGLRVIIWMASLILKIIFGVVNLFQPSPQRWSLPKLKCPKEVVIRGDKHENQQEGNDV